MKEIKINNHIILVDDEDFEEINCINWNIVKDTNTYYARNKKIGTIHRFILKLSKDDDSVIDHIDRNGLNNQKSNLRICTSMENSWNLMKRSTKTTSKYKGVYFEAGRNKWTASIQVNWKKIRLGRFNTEEEAAMCYNEAAIKYFKEFANLNIGV